MKKNVILISISGVILIVLILGISLFLKIYNQNKGLIYDVEGSMLQSFYVKGGYVIVNDCISVKNPTSEDISFHMYADMSEDAGLVTKKNVPACKKDTLEKQVFHIKSNSEQCYNVLFKGKNGYKKTKYDRRPPNDIVFEIIK